MSAAPDFPSAADECLRWLVDRLDRFDPDELEADVAGGVLRIGFPDGRNCILNRQAAVQQIWLAEGASAWHFERSADGSWLDTKGRGELRTVMEEVLTRRLGRPVSL